MMGLPTDSLPDRLAECGLADAGPAAGPLPAPRLARLLVVLVRPQFLLHPAPLDEFLEPSQGCPDRLPVVDPHPQSHASSSKCNLPRRRQVMREKQKEPRPV